jgi:hypothetical protein
VSNNKPPDTNAEAIAFGQYREWLEHPQTKMFFAQLEHDRLHVLNLASTQAINTSVDNAKEHNNLVRAYTYLKIIETYARSSKYPITVRAATL